MKNTVIKLLFLLLPLIGIAQQKNVVLELFTSQGCSSCPRADKLLEEVSENSNNTNVITLAYHVDYWNRLGWKDPFSKASYSSYQQEYGRKFGGRSIYTPQLVINGKKHIVGSDKTSLSAFLRELKSKELPTPISIKEVKKAQTSAVLQYVIQNKLNSRLNVVMLLRKQITQVKRGENRNRTLSDTHIVIDKKIINAASLEGEITFENVVYDLKELEFVAYLQKNDLEVIGATQWEGEK